MRRTNTNWAALVLAIAAIAVAVWAEAWGALAVALAVIALAASV